MGEIHSTNIMLIQISMQLNTCIKGQGFNIFYNMYHYWQCTDWATVARSAPGSNMGSGGFFIFGDGFAFFWLPHGGLIFALCLLSTAKRGRYCVGLHLFFLFFYLFFYFILFVFCFFCLSVTTITLEPLDLDLSNLVYTYILTPLRTLFEMKVIGQSSRSPEVKIVHFWHILASNVEMNASKCIKFGIHMHIDPSQKPIWTQGHRWKFKVTRGQSSAF